MRILVVEDEPLIRLGMVSMLEEAGFETCQASNADAAIQVLNRISDIALVVTDVDMPGSMDGVKLSHLVRNRWPPIQLILVSGKVGVLPAQLPASARFFSKPYQERQFMQAVGELMQQAGQSHP